MQKQIEEYRQYGLCFIPIIPGGKKPAAPWKEHIDTQLTDEQADAYAKRIVAEGLNVGILTGKLNNLVVVDFDYEHGGRDTLKELMSKGVILEGFQYVDTPHGRHYYFNYPSVEVRNRTDVMPGLDIRGEGGYVVAPPSKLDDGLSYVWGTNCELCDMPKPLLDLALKPQVKTVVVSGVRDYSSALDRGLKEGQGRNTMATALAGHFFNKGLAREEVSIILEGWNQKNDPPLDVEELENSISNIEDRELEKRSALENNKPAPMKDFDIPDDIPVLSNYVRLAKEALPSPPSYHVLSCLALMSVLLSEKVSLNLKSGTLYPNLYTMLLADTTWTYKTLAMGRAVDGVLDKVYPDAKVGNGGSPEGLFYALAERSGKASMFYKDEVVGFFYETGTKSYMAGMLESLTKFYDCQSEQRVLAGDTRGGGSSVKHVWIRDPRLTLLTGGTLTRFFDVVNEDRIMDGFLPRFLFSVRKGSANNATGLELADPKYSRDFDNMVNDIRRASLLGNRILSTDQSVLDLQRDYMRDLIDSEFAHCNGRDFGGVYNRLAINVLKVAVILACLDSNTTHVKMTEKHLLWAITLGQEWKQSIDYILRTIGKPPKERLYDKVIAFLAENRGSATIAALMNAFHLESREMLRITDTLKDREIVTVNDRVVMLK